MKKAVSLIELDVNDKMANALIFGDDFMDYLLDPLTISVNITQENELKNTGGQGHKIRLASLFVDFDPSTSEPKIENKGNAVRFCSKARH